MTLDVDPNLVIVWLNSGSAGNLLGDLLSLGMGVVDVELEEGLLGTWGTDVDVDVGVNVADHFVRVIFL